MLGVGFDNEVGVVVGDASVGVDVIDLEVDGKEILGPRDHIGAAFQERGEQQFEVAVTDDLVEKALPRDEEALILDDEGSGLA